MYYLKDLYEAIARRLAEDDKTGTEFRCPDPSQTFQRLYHRMYDQFMVYSNPSPSGYSRDSRRFENRLLI